MPELQEDRWPNAMGFYHPDGLKPAWDQAMRFAGKDGHIATLPEIIEARLATKPGDVPWESYFTTRSAEYVGFDRDGKKKIVVAHGVGPMSTLDGIMKAYSWEYKDKKRNNRGGRITQEEFWKLLDFEYGDVYVVDFEAYMLRYRYPFIQELRSLQALGDPLLAARLGMRAKEYVVRHTVEARRWHAAQAGIDPENTYNLPNYKESLDCRRAMHIRMAGEPFAPSDPFIVKLGDASYSYQFPIEEGMALAHLLSIGQLMEMRHVEDEPDGSRCGYESLVFDSTAHGWSDGTRFVAVRTGEVNDIVRGPSAHELLHKNWQKLMNPAGENYVGFRALMQLPDKTWFTQYEKRGAALDTCEPEFQVVSIEKAGEPVLFRTKVWGYYGFFKYLIRDVEKLAPVGANAYAIVGDPELDGGYEYQKATVQFYKVEVDGTKRVERQKDIENDFDLLMSLMIGDLHNRRRDQ